MKMIIRFKDPDAIGEFLWENIVSKKAAKLIKKGINEDDATDLAWESDKFGDKYFEFGDYGCVEIDIDETGKGTAKLLPIGKWPND